VVGQRSSVDDLVAHWVKKAAKRLAGNPGSPRELRERDLSAAVKFAINDDRRDCARTIVLKVDDWPSLGRSATDIVVVDEPKSRSPTIVFELKWCQQGRDKVHEAMWDLFKLALLARQYGVPGYLITGAPKEMWNAALGRELFTRRSTSSTELFDLCFSSGQPVWDWLLEGGYDRSPKRVPRNVETVEVATAPVSSSGLEWTIRAVQVIPSSDDLLLSNGWPKDKRPPRAKHPVAKASRPG
jgi:hypothetical protein